MLDRQIRIRQLVKVGVLIVRMPLDDAVFCPADKSQFVDAEASRGFRLRQHTAVTKSIVARAKGIPMDDIGDELRAERNLATTSSGRSAGAKSLLVEDVGDFGIDVV